MKVNEETLISVFILLVSCVAFIVPIHVFVSLAIIALILATLRLAKLVGDERPTASFIFAGVLVLLIGSLSVLKSWNFVSCLGFLAVFWFLRGLVILIKSQKSHEKEDRHPEKLNQTVIETESGAAIETVPAPIPVKNEGVRVKATDPIDDQALLEALFNQMDTKMMDFNVSLEEIKTKLNTIQEQTSKGRFETYIKTSIVQEKERLYAHYNNKKMDQSAVAKIVRDKLSGLTDKMDRFDTLIHQMTEQNKEREDTMYKQVLNVFEKFEHSLENQANQTEEITQLIDKGNKVFDEFEELVSSFKEKFKGFSQESIRNLATVICCEEWVPPIELDISYSGFGNLYTNVLEKEMKRIVTRYKGTVNEDRKLMWYDICRFLHTMKVPILSKKIPDIATKMETIRDIRNKYSHGGAMSKREYQLIRKIAWDQSVLEVISETLWKHGDGSSASFK